MFHWSARRIRAHITICFIAFALIRFLQHRIKKELKENFSAERIRRELYRIQDSILRNTATDEKYVIPSKPGNDAVALFDVMKKKRHVVPFRLTAEV